LAGALFFIGTWFSEVAKKMYENSLSRETYVFPVGGELGVTYLGVVEGQFVCNNMAPFKFPNYDEANRKGALDKNLKRLLQTISKQFG
jgi:hypothetical protein